MATDLHLYVRFRRHAHSLWEYGTLVGGAFDGERGEQHRWQMVTPLVLTRDEPTTLAVPILAERLRAVDSDFQPFRPDEEATP